MKWVYGLLLILSPAILYGLALISTALTGKFHRRTCPTCHQRGMVSVNHVMATVVIDGRRAPDQWSYYRCEKCGVVLKLHRGEWKPVPDDERHFAGLDTRPGTAVR